MARLVNDLARMFVVHDGAKGGILRPHGRLVFQACIEPQAWVGGNRGSRPVLFPPLMAMIAGDSRGRHGHAGPSQAGVAKSRPFKAVLMGDLPSQT